MHENSVFCIMQSMVEVLYFFLFMLYTYLMEKMARTCRNIHFKFITDLKLFLKF